MEFFSTDIYLPVDRHEYEVTIETPRRPTAFEWVAARIVSDFGKSGKFASARVEDVFRNALGCAGVDGFLATALDELFDPMVHVLETDRLDFEPRALPISEIRVTPEGERLLKTGQLPSAPRRERTGIVFDPVAGQVLAKDVDVSDSADADRRLDVDATAARPAEDAVRAVAAKGLKDGTQVGRVVPLGDPVRRWRRQRVFFTFEDGTVRLDRERGELASGTAEHLAALTPGRAQALFFSRAFAASAAYPSEAGRIPAGTTRVLTPAAAAGESSRPARVLLKGAGETLPGFAGETLEVVPGGALALEGEAGGRLTLTVPADGYPVAPGGICDRAKVREPVRVRCFYSGRPLELPVACERDLDEEARRALDAYLDRQVAGLPTAARAKVRLLLAESHEARLRVVGRLVAETRGEARAAALAEILADVHARRSFVDYHAVVDGVFGRDGLAAFDGPEEAEELLEKLPFLPEETRWARRHIERRRRTGGAAVQAPEDEFVWTEDSATGRNPRSGAKSKKHGKKRN